jgi:hypothetical protein
MKYFNPNEVKSPEYRAWSSMLSRCSNPKVPKFPRYGGRGIAVCARWRESFENFLADVGRRPSSEHSIDRWPNNDGNYEPGNVRWATLEEQGRNRSVNRMLTLNGVTLCITEWSEKTGLPYHVIWGRLKLEWSDECALTVPLHIPVSLFRGVSWERSRNKWAVILGGRHVGRFSEECNAALAYNLTAEIYGKVKGFRYNEPVRKA